MDLGSATMNSLQVTARIRDTNWKKNTRNQNIKIQEMKALYRSRGSEIENARIYCFDLIRSERYREMNKRSLRLSCHTFGGMEQGHYSAFHGCAPSTP